MSPKGAGWGELSQFMPYHIFGNIHGDKLLSIVNVEGMPYKFRWYGGPARPGFNRPLLPCPIQLLNLLEELRVDVRTFLYRTSHYPVTILNHPDEMLKRC